MNPLAIVALVVLGIGATSFVGALIEARAFLVRRVTVPVLEAGSEPIKVLHVSDIHFVPRQRKKARWLQALARLEPHLVINTGDNVAHPQALAGIMSALSPLLDRPGVFVHGSNDYFVPRARNPFAYLRGPTSESMSAAQLPADAMARAFVSQGWLDLNNACAALIVNGTTLDFVGVDDPHIGRDVHPTPRPLPPLTRHIRIGVTHAPYARNLGQFLKDGAAIVFAGHTHGGQVRLPLLGALVTNCDLDRRQARGLHRWPLGSGKGAGGCWLHVSAGIGTSPYAPIRFFCRPEATLVELVSVQTEPEEIV